MTFVPQRWPLATQILLRLLLNLLLVAAAFGAFILVQGRLNPGWLLAGRAGERLQTVAALLAGDLAPAREEDAPEIVERYQEAYHLEFLVFDPGGRLLTPSTALLPSELNREIVRPRRVPAEGPNRNAEFRPDPGQAPVDADAAPGPEPSERDRERERDRGPTRRWRPGPEGGEAPLMGQGPLRRLGDAETRRGRAGGAPWGLARIGLAPRTVLRAGRPPAYWIVLPLPLHRNGPPHSLVIRTDSLWSGGLLLDARPWFLAALGVIALSGAFWLPFVRAITRDIARMTGTTAEIAAGRFETRLELPRRDELGHLARSIDGMAARLSDHVAGQKRFLGDAAHELCTPIARMQAAVAILEARAGEAEQDYLRDLREELDEMAALVGELLSFSRATHGRAAQREPVHLRAVADRAWNREGASDAAFENRIPENLRAFGDPALLQRAFANLFRNALRYAAQDGPITIRAVREADHVQITVSDQGPGVPPEALPRLFEPFFRPEASRTRDLGGAGLGLAIVKTCMDACVGTVAARNLQPGGFEIALRLAAAPTPEPEPAVDTPSP